MNVNLTQISKCITTLESFKTNMEVVKYTEQYQNTPDDQGNYNLVHKWSLVWIETLDLLPIETLQRMFSQLLPQETNRITADTLPFHAVLLLQNGLISSGAIRSTDSHAAARVKVLANSLIESIKSVSGIANNIPDVIQNNLPSSDKKEIRFERQCFEIWQGRQIEEEYERFENFLVENILGNEKKIKLVVRSLNENDWKRLSTILETNRGHIEIQVEHDGDDHSSTCEEGFGILEFWNFKNVFWNGTVKVKVKSSDDKIVIKCNSRIQPKEKQCLQNILHQSKSSVHLKLQDMDSDGIKCAKDWFYYDSLQVIMVKNTFNGKVELFERPNPLKQANSQTAAANQSNSNNSLNSNVKSALEPTENKAEGGPPCVIQ